MRQRGHQRDRPNSQTGPLRSSGRPPRAGDLLRRDQQVVAGHAHGGEEEHAGVHVHRGDRAHDLTHDPAEGPAEVQDRVHGPEGQREDKLEVSQSQAYHKTVDGGVMVTSAAEVEQEECQEVTRKPQDTHDQVDQSDEDSHLTEQTNAMLWITFNI